MEEFLEVTICSIEIKVRINKSNCDFLVGVMNKDLEARQEGPNVVAGEC